MKISAALDKAWAENRLVLPLHHSTRLAIFSDIHRGAGDRADDFTHNSRIFSWALDFYFQDGFAYLELGDGDELYENPRLSDVVRAHGSIFCRLQRFHEAGRFLYLLGNHNAPMSDPLYRRRSLAEARNIIPGLFQGLTVHRTARLGGKIFLFHGHQGDDLSLPFFEPWGRFLVRHIWRPFQDLFGFKDPTSAAQNIRKRSRLERGYLAWAQSRGRIAISGHTHRPMFMSLGKKQRLEGEPEKPFYFNPGSGVHPTCVTGLEVKDGTMFLVKWCAREGGRSNSGGRVKRCVLAHRRLSAILAALDRP